MSHVNVTFLQIRISSSLAQGGWEELFQNSIDNIPLRMVWRGLVWLQERIIKRHVFKEIVLCVQNIQTNIGSTCNMFGGAIWSFDEHKNLHFDNEWDIHMNSKNVKLVPTMVSIWILQTISH